MLSPELLMLLFFGGVASIAIIAYHMGWDAGHSIHHSDDMTVRKPPKPPTLYQ